MAGVLLLGADVMQEYRYPAQFNVPAPMLAIITDLPPIGASYPRTEKLRRRPVASLPAWIEPGHVVGSRKESVSGPIQATCYTLVPAL